MVQVVIIDKTGNCNNNNIINIDDLYKKCGFKKVDDFEMIHTWRYNDTITVELWGRLVAKGGIKNEYTFPGDIKKCIYGNCAVVARDANYIDFSVEMWENMLNISSLVEELSDKMNIDKKIDTEKSELEIDGEIDGQSDGSDVTDITDTSDTSDNSEESSENMEDSELKPESYIYSSEEEA